MADDLPQVALGTADYVIMVLYMLGLIGLGLYYRKYAHADLDHYFLAGRREIS